MGGNYSTAGIGLGDESIVVFAVDAEGVFTFSEGSGLEVLGLRAGELVGMSAFEAYAEEPAVSEDLRRALSGEAFESVVEVSGTALKCRYEPLRDDDNALVGAVGFGLVSGGRERTFESWFAKIFGSSPDLVMIAGPRGGMRYVNSSACGLLGYEPEDFLGLSDDLAGLIEKVLHPEDRGFVLAELAGAVGRSGSRTPVEVRARHRDGAWRHFESYINNLSHDPTVGRIVFVSRDVTERVRAQEEAQRLNARLEAAVSELEERERILKERFSLVSQATKEAIWDVDLVADRQSWYGAIERMLGYPCGQTTDWAWWEGRVHPEDRRRVLSKIGAVLRRYGAETWSDEYRFLRADGSYAVVMDRGYVARDPSTGEPVRMLGSMADVTVRRRAEEELKESERRHRFAFEEAPVGMAYLDLRDGRWLLVNRALCTILGYSREELLAGMTCRDVTYPDDLDADSKQAERVLAGEIRSCLVERRCLRKDGKVVWASLTVSLKREASGEPDCFMLMVEDVTERKLKEIISDPLKPRELKVLRRIAAGRTDPQVAEDLHQSFGTVKSDVRRILRKLGAKNRAKAAGQAVKIGLIPPPSS